MVKLVYKNSGNIDLVKCDIVHIVGGYKVSCQVREHNDYVVIGETWLHELEYIEFEGKVIWHD